MHPATFARLRDILTNLYPDVTSIQRIIADAGLDLAHITLNSTPANNWHAVLTEAEKVNQVAALLDVVVRDYGSNREFQEAYRAYRQSSTLSRNQPIRLDPSVDTQQPQPAYIGEPAAPGSNDNPHSLEPTTPAQPSPASTLTRWFAWWAQLKTEYKVSITVALISAISAILAAVLPLMLATSPATPTPVTGVTSSPSATPAAPTAEIATPTVAASQSTVTISPTPIPIPLVTLTPLQVGVAAFANCADENFSHTLQEQIKTDLTTQRFEQSKAQFTELPEIVSKSAAQGYDSYGLIIWGGCLADNQIDYHVELLLLRDGLDHRIAQPDSLYWRLPVQSATETSATLAGIIAYYSSTGADTTEVAAILLSKSSARWDEFLDSNQKLGLFLILGNAWLNHVDNFYDEALRSYQMIIAQLALPQDTDLTKLVLAAYLNRGWAYYSQRKYEPAVEAFSQVIELDKSYTWGYFGRSAALIRLRKEEHYSQALDDCSQIAKLRANFAPVYICRAWATFYPDISDGFLSTTKISEFADHAIHADPHGQYPAGYWYAGIQACLADHDKHGAIEDFETFLAKALVLPIWDADHDATIKGGKIWLEEDLVRADSCR